MLDWDDNIIIDLKDPEDCKNSFCSIPRIMNLTLRKYRDFG